MHPVTVTREYRVAEFDGRLVGQWRAKGEPWRDLGESDSQAVVAAYDAGWRACGEAVAAAQQDALDDFPEQPQELVRIARRLARRGPEGGR